MDKQAFWILILLFSAICIESNGQEIVTIPFDAEWKITRSKNAVFRRSAEARVLNDSIVFDGEFTDEKIDGTMLARGRYESGRKDGIFQFYHPNGVLESEGQYADDQRTGIWKYYNEFGGDKQTVSFTGSGFDIQVFYDEKGKRLVDDGTGNWHLFVPLGDRFAEIDAFFEAGKRAGRWTLRYYQGSKILREEYDGEGRLIEGIDYRGKGKATYSSSRITVDIFEVPRLAIIESFQTDGNYYGPDAIMDIIGKPALAAQNAAIQPKYAQGIEAFYTFVSENYRYPEQAYSAGLQGQVIVNFMVSADGSTSDFRIMKGISQALNKEAVRLIRAADGWVAGTVQGKAVSSRITVPMDFRIAK